MRMTGKTKAWDRVVEPSDADLVEDVMVISNQVQVSYQGLQDLCWSVDQWVETRNEFCIQIGANHQSLELGIVKDTDLISTYDNPVFKMAYELTKVKVCLRFVVDQTCIIQLQEGLHQWLSGRSGSDNGCSQPQ